MSTRTAVPRVDTSRLVGGPPGVQQQLTHTPPGKKGTPEPAPLGAVVGGHWRARSVLGTLPDGQKTGLWRTLNQVRAHKPLSQKSTAIHKIKKTLYLFRQKKSERTRTFSPNLNIDL